MITQEIVQKMRKMIADQTSWNTAAEFQALQELAQAIQEKFATTPNLIRHMQEKRGDPVERPAHYNQGRIEVIEFLEDQKLPHHEACVVKYVVRARHKGNELQDLEKAAWYLRRRIQQLKRLLRMTPGKSLIERAKSNA